MSLNKNQAFKPHAKFTAEEDELLRNLVTQYGENDWSLIASKMNSRNSRQVKERWQYYLNPSLKPNTWSAAEDEKLVSLYSSMGSKWVTISRYFDGKTDAMVKNRYQLLSRRAAKAERKARKTALLQQGKLAEPQPKLVASPTVQPVVEQITFCYSDPKTEEPLMSFPEPESFIEPTNVFGDEGYDWTLPDFCDMQEALFF